MSHRISSANRESGTINTEEEYDRIMLEQTQVPEERVGALPSTTGQSESSSASDPDSVSDFAACFVHWWTVWEFPRDTLEMRFAYRILEEMHYEEPDYFDTVWEFYLPYERNIFCAYHDPL